MTWLLDTNVVSELRKAPSGRANRKVVAWAAAQAAAALHISVVTLLELEIGVLALERRDRPQGAVLRRWLDLHVVPAFAGRIVVVDAAVARQCARLQVPDRMSERDALIAATGIVHGMTVVTRNRDDFLASGVPLLDPWT